jgi:hypothetical protein
MKVKSPSDAAHVRSIGVENPSKQRWRTMRGVLVDRRTGDGPLRPGSGAASQTIDGDEDGGPLKHLDQSVEQPFVVVMSWLKIFFKNVLGFTDGLNGQFLIAHRLGTPMQLNRSFNSEPVSLFPPSEPGP